MAHFHLDGQSLLQCEPTAAACTKTEQKQTVGASRLLFPYLMTCAALSKPCLSPRCPIYNRHVMCGLAQPKKFIDLTTTTKNLSPAPVALLFASISSFSFFSYSPDFELGALLIPIFSSRSCYFFERSLACVRLNVPKATPQSWLSSQYGGY